jgi:hypothetical protein
MVVTTIVCVVRRLGLVVLVVGSRSSRAVALWRISASFSEPLFRILWLIALTYDLHSP